MNILIIKPVGLVTCAVIAVASVVANETLTHLGNVYWFGLWSLAVVHLAVSAVVLTATSRNFLFSVAVAALLFVGQWRALQMIAMLTIWQIRGFAP